MQGRVCLGVSSPRSVGALHRPGSRTGLSQLVSLLRAQQTPRCNAAPFLRVQGGSSAEKWLRCAD